MDAFDSSTGRAAKFAALAACLFLLVAALQHAAAQQDDEPVRIDLRAFVVNEVTGDDGEVEERLEPATQAFPGQVIEYQLEVSNQAGTTLPTGTVVITVPVPEGTSYVPGSASMAPGEWRTEFSADGGETFHEPPLETTVTDDAGDEVEVVVDEEDYDAVRWTLLVPFEPDDTLELVYRVRIED